ncbi:MAG: hypothetical protein L0216_07110 [Planctomycetales bacterium]|nr:hypothetical protein [Planctomycetales bacterium]
MNLGAGSTTVCGISVASGSVGTLAGIPPPTPTPGFNGDNQAATSARLDTPTAALRIAGGHVLLVDSVNQRIRRVDQATAIVTTICGTGLAGYNGDGIPPVNANLNAPSHFFLDSASPPNLFFADSGNRRVRRFTP